MKLAAGEAKILIPATFCLYLNSSLDSPEMGLHFQQNKMSCNCSFSMFPQVACSFFCHTLAGNSCKWLEATTVSAAAP
jgi:hypothetical protein